jgi:hypothetical protein
MSHLLQQHIAWHARSTVWSQQVCVEQQHQKLSIGICRAYVQLQSSLLLEQQAEQNTQALCLHAASCAAAHLPSSSVVKGREMKLAFCLFS